MALALLPAGVHGSTLVFYNGNSGPPFFNTVNGPNSVASGITNVSPISDVDGTLLFPAAFPKWRATSFDDGNAFLFSFAVAQGSQVSLTDFIFDDLGTSNGPISWTLSINGQFIKTGPVETFLDTESASLAMTGLTGTINFRLSATGASSSAAAYSIDSVQVNGVVTTVPEPSLAALMFSGALFCFYRRSLRHT